MPKYACEPERYEGSVFPPFWPLDVFDANGVCLGPFIRYFEIETGIVISTAQDDTTGHSKVTNGHFVETVSLHPAPLTMRPYDPANSVLPSVVVGGS